jgi:hypothetical protein
VLQDFFNSEKEYDDLLAGLDKELLTTQNRKNEDVVDLLDIKVQNLEKPELSPSVLDIIKQALSSSSSMTFTWMVFLRHFA